MLHYVYYKYLWLKKNMCDVNKQPVKLTNNPTVCAIVVEVVVLKGQVTFPGIGGRVNNVTLHAVYK